MPTVLRKDGFRFFFFSNEGTEPRHIHVETAEGYGKFWLDPVELANSKRLKPPVLAAARALVDDNADLFREKWDEIFGA